jgi:hypothetical protein
MAISSTVLDFYDDSSKELMSKIAAPANIGEAHTNVLSDEERGSLPDTDFGLIILTKRASVLRKFPVNDPGNAWLSSQYFDQTHEKLAFPARFIAAKFIKQACDAYGVPSSPTVDGYAARSGDEANDNIFAEGAESKWMLSKLAQRELMSKQATAVEQQALINMPDDHYALVVQVGDGSIVRKYAMPDAQHVKMAADYFDKYAMDLAPSHRHRFAVSVRGRAEELDVRIEDGHSLNKWASVNWNRHVDAHLEQRKSLLHPDDRGSLGILDKLASAIGDSETEDFAHALETFDAATGLDRYYDRGLTDAYSSTMNKAASGWSAEVDGETITEEHLKKAAASPRLKSYLGEAFAISFGKNAATIFESLPMPEKTLIKQIATGEA